MKLESQLDVSKELASVQQAISGGNYSRNDLLLQEALRRLTRLNELLEKPLQLTIKHSEHGNPVGTIIGSSRCREVLQLLGGVEP